MKRMNECINERTNEPKILVWLEEGKGEAQNKEDWKSPKGNKISGSGFKLYIAFPFFIKRLAENAWEMEVYFWVVHFSQHFACRFENMRVPWKRSLFGQSPNPNHQNSIRIATRPGNVQPYLLIVDKSHVIYHVLFGPQSWSRKIPDKRTISHHISSLREKKRLCSTWWRDVLNPKFFALLFFFFFLSTTFTSFGDSTSSFRLQPQ